jgi:hypothetical protein
MAELKFADPKNDVAFKKIFGNENKKEVSGFACLAMLNSLGWFRNPSHKDIL